MFDKFKKYILSIESRHPIPRIYQLIDLEYLRQYYERLGSPFLNLHNGGLTPLENLLGTLSVDELSHIFTTATLSEIRIFNNVYSGIPLDYQLVYNFFEQEFNNAYDNIRLFLDYSVMDMFVELNHIKKIEWILRDHFTLFDINRYKMDEILITVIKIAPYKIPQLETFLNYLNSEWCTPDHPNMAYCSIQTIPHHSPNILHSQIKQHSIFSYDMIFSL